MKELKIDHRTLVYALVYLLDDSRSPDYADDAITRSSQYIYELKTSVISK